MAAKLLRVAGTVVVAATMKTRLLSTFTVVAVTAGVLALTAGPGAASRVPSRGFEAIEGSGSSWPGVAIDLWARHAAARGLVVNYNPDGSGTGRAEFINNQVDFAASDPPFRSHADELAGAAKEVVPYSYSYVPDVAGGTAFLYHLSVHGHLIKNLKLSGRTLMDIFTGRITNWDDPRIAADNRARLPDRPITPVIHAEFSGDTFFFSRWMATMFPAAWNAFCKRVHPGIKLPCPPTELYPQFGRAKMENGSNNVAAYINSSFGNGSIGYDEYAYALGFGSPVVRLRNPAGHYVRPTAANVSIALTQAILNDDTHSVNFLQQDLDKVYTFKNPQSYPLASYSYFIVPRTPKPPPILNRQAGRSLSTFIDYALCRGQRQLAGLGYAPLPANLVKGGLLQAGHIPGHVPVPSLSRCLDSGG